MLSDTGVPSTVLNVAIADALLSEVFLRVITIFPNSSAVELNNFVLVLVLLCFSSSVLRTEFPGTLRKVELLGGDDNTTGFTVVLPNLLRINSISSEFVFVFGP